MQTVCARPAGGVTLVLASASPRRRELLALLGVPFTVRPAGIDETIGAEPAAAAVHRLARQKATSVSAELGNAAVLAADTLVTFDGVGLGKPATPEVARRHLQALRGREHTVVTGVCLRLGGVEAERLVTTRVRMRAYMDSEIEQTIARGTPFDKAGGYGIQDAAFHPVDSFDGCYCNVMGLPLWTVHGLLEAACSVPRLFPPDRRSPICAACPLRA